MRGWRKDLWSLAVLRRLCALRSICLSCICIGLTGCGLSQWVHNDFKLGPDYCPPAAAIADNWIDSDDPQILEKPPEYADWWSVFEDPVLDHLIETAYDQNLSVREAGWRVMQARAQRAIVAGTIFPQEQFLEGGYARQQLGVLAQPHVLPAPTFQRSFDHWFYGGNLSWELDVWGRFRRAIESADAGLNASIEEYDAILVSLVSEVASTYIEIRTLEERLVYARQNVSIQEGSLGLAKARADEGKTGEISVYLSRSNLESTRARIPALEVQLRQANNRLCTLLGMPTTDLRYLLGEGNIPSAPAEIAVGIPADLLRRRPDVRAAEQLVAAQSAQIGVAQSALYPSIAITGQITISAEHSSDLFKPLSQGGSIGPSFQWNVLNYGRLVNNVSLQDARLQELIASYQNTVLEANSEVESAMVSFLKLKEQVKYLASSVRETEKALELAVLNFKEGESDFTGVFILQGDLAVKQDQYAAAQGQVVASLSALYRALGGGWEIRYRDSVPGYISISAPLDDIGKMKPQFLPPLPPLPDVDQTDSQIRAN